MISWIYIFMSQGSISRKSPHTHAATRLVRKSFFNGMDTRAVVDTVDSVATIAKWWLSTHHHYCVDRLHVNKGEKRLNHYIEKTNSNGHQCWLTNMKAWLFIFKSITINGALCLLMLMILWVNWWGLEEVSCILTITFTPPGWSVYARIQGNS